MVNYPIGKLIGQVRTEVGYVNDAERSFFGRPPPAHGYNELPCVRTLPEDLNFVDIKLFYGEDRKNCIHLVCEDPIGLYQVCLKRDLAH